MIRHLLNLLTLLSLLLCMVVVTMWVRSRWSTDTFSRRTATEYVEVTSAGGLVEVRRFNYGRARNLSADERRIRYVSGPATTAGRQPFVNRLGFGAGRVRRPDGAYTMSSHVVPRWSLALLATAPAAPLAWSARRVRLRRHRQSLGLCPACGYDLRATPDRCPECGTAK